MYTATYMYKEIEREGGRKQVKFRESGRERERVKEREREREGGRSRSRERYRERAEENQREIERERERERENEWVGVKRRIVEKKLSKREEIKSVGGQIGRKEEGMDIDKVHVR